MFVTFENLGQPDRYEEGVEELCGHEPGCPEQSHTQTEHTSTEIHTLWLFYTDVKTKLFCLFYHIISHQ